MTRVLWIAAGVAIGVAVPPIGIAYCIWYIIWGRKL